MKEDREGGVRVVAKLDRNDLERIAALLPDGSDPDLLVLKGHLLVEARLREMLHRIARDPAPIEKARIGFWLLVQLVKGIYFHPGDEKLWRGVQLLGEVRNALGHYLDPPAVPERLAELHAITLDELDVEWVGEEPTPQRKLRMTIAAILARLRAIRDERGDA